MLNGFFKHARIILTILCTSFLLNKLALIITLKNKEMPKVKNIEKKIWDIEGFDVQFQRGTKNVHGAKEGIPPYPYSNAAKNDMTVNEWKQIRFNNSYPGFDVAILNGDGVEAPGQTKLGRVRDTYNEDNN